MFYKIFSDTCVQAPEAKAIITSADETFTYKEAQNRVYQWVHYFMQQGITADDRVGVLLQDEDHYVFIHLALSCLNAAYVPFNQAIPPKQLAIDLEQQHLKKLFIQTELLKKYAPPSAVVLEFSKACWQDIQNLEAVPPVIPESTDDHISYIVSSSGSTGDKKWIPIRGSGLLYWARLERERNKKYPANTMISTRSPGFDAQIYEALLMFATGGTLYLLNTTQRKDMSYVESVCQRAQIRKLLLIASQVLVGDLEALIQRLHSYGLTDLMVTGDACSPKLKAYCEHYGIRLWNCYGPTEATFGLSVILVNGTPLLHNGDHHSVAIGKPEDVEVSCKIIDGKLYINSPYMMKDYLVSAPDDQAFIEEQTDSGEMIRWFATGDYFNEDPDTGLLYFLGREQFCKPGGVKVSAPYLEQCLNEYKPLSNYTLLEVTVVIKPYLNEDRPFAYVVVTPDFDNEAFKHYLKDRLEREKRPIVVKMDALPRLVTSYKIDKRALVESEDTHSSFLFYERALKSVDDNQPHVKAVRSMWVELFQLSNDYSGYDLDFESNAGTSLDSLHLHQSIKLYLKNTLQLATEYRYEYLLRLEDISIATVANSIEAHLQGLSPSDDLLAEEALIQSFGHSTQNDNPCYLLPPLLGSGACYKNLAESMSKEIYSTIYALSDPGVNDSALLPRSAEHAARRYANTIKRKQLQSGAKYCTLGGYSYGSYLATLVAEILEAEDITVLGMHLIDGYPPVIYQSLPDKAHFNLLNTLIEVMRGIFNNRYYAEQLEPVILEDYSTYNKMEQIEYGLNFFKSKLKNPASICSLLLAKQHLIFLLAAKKPQPLEFPEAIFYLTNQQQPYHQVIQELPEWSEHSVDYEYYGWNKAYYKRPVI